MEPKTPNDFSSPNEREIIELEQQYSKALASGEIFEVLKGIRSKIKLLKSDLTTTHRGKNLGINQEQPVPIQIKQSL